MTNKNQNAKVSSIQFDSCYLLTKGVNGVKAKFVGTPIVGSKKKAIWVPKSLVTNCLHQNLEREMRELEASKIVSNKESIA